MNQLNVMTKEERIKATLLEEVRFNGGNEYVRVQLPDGTIGRANKNAMLFEGRVFDKGTTVYIKPYYFSILNSILKLVVMVIAAIHKIVV